MEGAWFSDNLWIRDNMGWSNKLPELDVIRPYPYTPWGWYIYLHDWVILFGQMLGFIFHTMEHMGY